VTLKKEEKEGREERSTIFRFSSRLSLLGRGRGRFCGSERMRLRLRMDMRVRVRMERVMMRMNVRKRSGIIAADLRDFKGGKFSSDLGRDLRARRGPSSPCCGHHVMMLRGKDHLKILRGQRKHWVRGVKGGG